MPLTAAELERLRKFQLQIAGPDLAISTNPPESVHTDEAEAPSSPLTITEHVTRHWLPLEDLCPSLVVPRRMLRKLTHPKQLPQMVTLVTVFSSSIDSVLKSIHSKQFLLRTDHVYTLLHASILGANRGLNQHVKTMVRGDLPRTAEAIEMTMEFVDTIALNFLLLHRTVEAFHREKLKALPDSPDEESDEEADLPDEVASILISISKHVEDGDELLPESSVEMPSAIITRRSYDEKSLPDLPIDIASDGQDDEKSLPDLPDDVSDAPELSSSTEDSVKLLPESAVSDTIEFVRSSPRPISTSKIPLAMTTPKRSKHKFIQRLLQLRADFGKLKTVEKGVTRMIFIPDELNSPGPLFRSEPREDQPYIVRQSFIYDRADPLCPDEKVDMPLPTGEVVAVRLDSNGDVKAASLPALIQLLSSHHTLPVDDICETFFLFFRLFSSPERLLVTIQARWDEQPPRTGIPLNPAQQRVWAHHMCYIRNCLAQLLLTWLDEYWRPAEDGCVLARLRALVVKRFKNAGLVQGITTLVLNALDRAAQEEHTSRAQRARHIERQGAPPESESLPLNLVLRPQDDYRLNIAVFETTDGRERFAGQITALAHKHFRALDPEVAVARWLTNEPTFFEIQKLEEALLMWVAQSIVELQNREERVAMIEFWLDVATICATLRNFSSASAIFGGLVFSPVERLSLTILNVAIPSKEQYRQLNRLFDGANNYAVYRRTLAANAYPAVPLILVLRKDVISTNEISGPVALTNDPGAEKTLINFSAFRTLKKTICTMETCLVPYNIQPVGMIQDWIGKQLAVLPHDEHQALTKRLETMSDQLEARAPYPIKKGETWLQTVKGYVATGEFTLHTLPDPGTTARPAPKLRKNK
ncbi:ras guanine nucleotide exchange factor domain-containing protein [Mycena capillaripes]|nr:ras guanine nucleotide exchange factor domain-containing protein [Mycena capillaripes]